MKRTVMTMWLCVVGMVLGISTIVWAASPMGMAVTYQGRLMDGDSPADGEYDFEFKLYIDPVGIGEPNQVGSDINVENQQVSGGLFTVELDFGSDVFTGEARWLEIGVRPGDSEESFTTLSPRQEMTPTPYSLHTRGVLLESTNTIVGLNTGQTGAYNTFMGRYAGKDNSTGVFNTYVGSFAGSYNTSGKNNAFFGHGAGYQNTVGNSNSFLGYEAGYENTNGGINTFLGYSSGHENTSGGGNAFLGSYSGYYNTIGQANTFLGHGAGFRNTVGSYNCFLGYETGYENTTGSQNLFLGYRTGNKNTTGKQNTFLGTAAGYRNTSGLYNTFLGDGTGYFNTTGSSNTFLGRHAGFNNQTGSGNVFVGKEAGAFANGSNKLFIANGPEEPNTLIYGDFVSGRVGIGTISPEAELHVNGAIRLGGGGRNFEIQEVSPANPVGWASYIGYEGIGIGSDDGTNRQMFMFTDGAGDQNIFTVATSENNSTTWEADFVIQQNGNVGIGTTSPAEELDIAGDVRLNKNSGALILRTPNQNDPARYSIRFQNNYIAPILGDDTQDQNFAFMTDFVKARNYSAHVKVHGQAADSWGTYLELTHDGSDGKIITDQGDIVLEPAQNVGIGTTEPSELLHVAGIAYSSSGGFKFPDGTVQTTAFEDLTFPYSQEATLSGHAFEITNDYLGAGSAAVVGKNNTNIGKLGAPANGVYAETNHTNGIAINGLAKNTSGYGNVGGFFESKGTDGKGVWAVANSTGGYGVYSEGQAYDFYAAGAGVDWGSSSSIRWKQNIQSIEKPLSKLTSLRGVYFDWDVAHGGGHDVGMIAEEVGQVLPEIVCYEENDIDAIGMDYSKLTPLLVEAVKELKREKDAEIAELKDRLTAMKLLRKENIELRARLTALESVVDKMSQLQKGGL